MFKNNLKIAWRNLFTKRFFSIINILGLTVGMAACLLMVSVAIDDLSYDRHWKTKDRLYRIIRISQQGVGLSSKSSLSLSSLANAFPQNFAEVEAVGPMSTFEKRLKVKENEPDGIEANILMADTAIWQTLNPEIIAGTPRKFVPGDNINLVISESFRKKYFADESPVGKIIYDVPTYTEKGRPYFITGVIKDIPTNSVFRSDAIEINKPNTDILTKSPSGNLTEHYVLMKPHTNMAVFTKKNERMV